MKARNWKRAQTKVLGIHAPLRGIIFDGDDTLWSTQPLYDSVTRKFGDLMAIEGFGRHRAIKRLTMIDLQNVAKLGFHRRRFPVSLVQAYRALCHEEGRSAKRAISASLRAMGSSVFSSTPLMIPGANEFLTFLKGKTRRMLVTAGDRVVQSHRIKQLGLASDFEAIYIPRQKTQKVLRSILKRERLLADEVLLIGNSGRSDVKPAIAVGLSVIWLRGAGWEYDTARIRSRRVYSVNGLAEAKRVVEMLMENSPTR